MVNLNFSYGKEEGPGKVKFYARHSFEFVLFSCFSIVFFFKDEIQFPIKSLTSTQFDIVEYPRICAELSRRPTWLAESAHRTECENVEESKTKQEKKSRREMILEFF